MFATLPGRAQFAAWTAEAGDSVLALVLSQYVEASYAGDLLADGSGAVRYLLKDRVARVGEFPDAWAGTPAG